MSKRMGRPPLPPGAKLSRAVLLHLTEAEYQEFAAGAKATEQAITRFILEPWRSGHITVKEWVAQFRGAGVIARAGLTGDLTEALKHPAFLNFAQKCAAAVKKHSRALQAEGKVKGAERAG